MSGSNPRNGPPQLPNGSPPQGEPLPFFKRGARLADFAWKVLVAVVILAVAYFLWYSVHILLQAFAGMLFAVFLNALARWVNKRTGIRYGWSLTLVIVLLFAAAGGLTFLLANRLGAQASEMTREVPKSFEKLRDYLSQYEWGKLLVEQVPKAAQRMVTTEQFTKVTGLVSGVAGFLETIVIFLIVGIFGAAEPDLYRQGLLHLVPLRHRARVADALDAIVYNLHWWLVGQFVLMIAIGVTTWVGLELMGIKLALTLGIIAGIMEMVPYIGPWLSAIPAMLMALLEGPHYVLLVMGLYLFLHILEGYVLVPLVQSRAVKLPPAFTLVMQVLLGETLGLMGLFVAAPLTVAIVVLVKILYVKDTLGDQKVEVPGEPAHQEEKAAVPG